MAAQDWTVTPNPGRGRSHIWKGRGLRGAVMVQGRFEWRGVATGTLGVWSHMGRGPKECGLRCGFRGMAMGGPTWVWLWRAWLHVGVASTGHGWVRA